MTQQIINVGSAINDGTGDPARVAFTHCNENFTELYQVSRPTGNTIEYQFNNSTTEPPSTGQIRFNQATQASTTKIWASHITSSGINIKQFLAAATSGAKLVLQDKIDNTNYIKFDVTGAPVDKTTYWEFAVAVTASGGTLPNAAILAAVTAAASSVGPTAPQHGRFEYVSATQCKFAPFDGDSIRIGGTIYAIPAAGIAGLTNGGLSASTLYYAYAYNNSGTITGEFSATGHTKSATAGNVGTEIKSGDNSRTLLGMVWTNASAQFQYDTANKFVISWFNRRSIEAIGPSTAGVSTNSTSYVELNGSGSRANFLSWSNEAVVVGQFGLMILDTSSQIIFTKSMMDGTTDLVFNQATAAIAGAQNSIGGASALTVAEGFHFISPRGAVTAGIGSFHINVNATIRG